jgi:hypothetical protein
MKYNNIFVPNLFCEGFLVTNLFCEGFGMPVILLSVRLGMSVLYPIGKRYKRMLINQRFTLRASS